MSFGVFLLHFTSVYRQRDVAQCKQDSHHHLPGNAGMDFTTNLPSSEMENSGDTCQ